jgi:hypothetical protein
MDYLLSKLGLCINKTGSAWNAKRCTSEGLTRYRVHIAAILRAFLAAYLKF